MNKVIWKAQNMSSIFERSTKSALGESQKSLNIRENKDDEYTIALISASRNGSGRVGYIHLKNEDLEKVSKNKLTFDDQWGFTYFQKEDFIITGGHNAILEIILPKLKELLDNNLFCYDFLSLIINKITLKSTMFGYGYKINNKFDREIILLPCLEVSEKDDWIWEENGKYFTLAVDYIKKLMDEAKELREQKTIRLYEAEKKKYEAEYLKEKQNVVWKGYELGSLFSWSSRKDLSLKDYNLFEEYNEGYVEVITGSKNDDNRYVDKNELPPNYPIYQNCLCLNCNGSIGYCFYYKNEIVSPTSSVHILIHKYEKLENIMNEIINQYLSKTITTIFAEKMYNRTSCLIDNPKFDREIILLPCLEVSEKDDWIWEENGKYYTLATSFISYIYLQGRCNYYQKLIDKWTYQY